MVQELWSRFKFLDMLVKGHSQGHYVTNNVITLGMNGKASSKGMCMLNTKTLNKIVQKLW